LFDNILVPQLIFFNLSAAATEKEIASH